jgi:predicted nucleic acid-binding protein
MKYLLDSNIVSDIYNPYSPNHQKLALKFRQLKNTDKVYISILTLYEMSYGVANAPEDKKSEIKRQLSLIHQHFSVLQVPYDGIILFGELKKTLREKRMISSKNIPKHKT